MHATIASAAMDLGKHVYVQKPLTWSVEEARLLAQKAKDKKIATQMGNQGHSGAESPDDRGVHPGRARSATSRKSTSGPTVRSATGRRDCRDPTPRPRRQRQRPAAAVERPRRREAARRGDGGQLPGARQAELGSVPRRRAARRLSPGLSPVQLARLGGLGPGGARRHGRAPDRLPVLGARARHADQRRDDLDAVQRRLLPEFDDDLLRVRRARQQAGGEADVVRRRHAAAASGGVQRRDGRAQRPDGLQGAGQPAKAASCTSAARAS